MEGQTLEIDGEKIFEVFEETTEEKLQQEKEAKEKRQRDIIAKQRREKGGTRKPGVRFIGMEESPSKIKDGAGNKKNGVWGTTRKQTPVVSHGANQQSILAKILI